MVNIKFLNEEAIHQADVKSITSHVIEINGVNQNTSGFHILTDEGDISGKYENYTTLYRVVENGFQLSDDESVYVEPEPPETEPIEPYVPTLEEVQESKVYEMNAAQQETINYGMDVKLTDGTTEHFSLTQYDQQSLMGLQSLVAEGTENIPWHNSNEAEHCKFYSNADMKLIIASALAYVTYHVTYFRDLRIYIRSLDDKELIQKIQYGDSIPTENQSEVLQVMLVQAQSDHEKSME